MEIFEGNAHQPFEALGSACLWLAEHQNAKDKARRIAESEPDDTRAAVLLQDLLEPQMIGARHDEPVPWSFLALVLRPPWSL